MLYHRSWYKTVDDAKAGLGASLLVRHSDTKKIYVNFDPMILELIHESKCLMSMKLEIPQSAVDLCIREKDIRDANVA